MSQMVAHADKGKGAYSHIAEQWAMETCLDCVKEQRDDYKLAAEAEAQLADEGWATSQERGDYWQREFETMRQQAERQEATLRALRVEATNRKHYSDSPRTTLHSWEDSEPLADVGGRCGLCDAVAAATPNEQQGEPERPKGHE